MKFKKKITLHTPRLLPPTLFHRRPRTIPQIRRQTRSAARAASTCLRATYSISSSAISTRVPSLVKASPLRMSSRGCTIDAQGLLLLQLRCSTQLCVLEILPFDQRPPPTSRTPAVVASIPGAFPLDTDSQPLPTGPCEMFREAHIHKLLRWICIYRQDTRPQHSGKMFFPILSTSTLRYTRD